MKIDSLRFGIAGGIVFSTFILLVTTAGMFGYFEIYNSMIVEFYGILGYSNSAIGIFLASFYGFLDGFFVVWLFGFIYNWLLRKF